MIKTPLSTMIGGAFWTPRATIIGGTSKTFNQLIKSLFANNEQGFFYDPNDLSTMFQDSAGTVPVTVVGQPVGLMLDKSKGLALGGELQPSGNLIGFSSGQQFVATTDTQFTTVASGHGVSKEMFTVGKFYAVSVSGNSTTGFTVNTADSVNPTSRTQIRVGFGTCIIQADKPFLYLRNYGAGTTNITSISVRELSGNHAYQTTSASRPILRQNATTGAYYLEFDGSDDFLQTGNVDFTGTDKVSLFAGVRKLSDATTGLLCELGIASPQAFSAYAPAANGQYKFNTRNIAVGIGALTESSLYSAPKSVVLSANIDSASSIEMRLNATSEATSADVARLAMISAPVYIGRRGGTSLPFNGHIYSLIGVGRLTTTNETAAIEKELAKRTGVVLSV